MNEEAISLVVSFANQLKAISRQLEAAQTVEEVVRLEDAIDALPGLFAGVLETLDPEGHSS